MKLFDVDWQTVLRELPRWSMLSLEARRVLLDALKTSGYAPGSHFGEQRDAIVASGIPTFDAERNRLALAEEHRELLKVLRAMSRHPVFDAPSLPALVSYLEEHFTNEEINRLGGNASGLAYGHVSRQTLAPRVAFAGWPGDLLTAERDAELLAWGKERGMSTVGRIELLQLRALQALVRQFVAEAHAVPMSVWYTKLSPGDRQTFASTVHLGLSTVVLFGGMRGHDLEPMIGLWPSAVQALTRPPAAKPSVVVPVEQFEAAILLEDMTALLATVVAAPVRVRANDMAVFARTRAEIETRLLPIPEWAVPVVIGPDRSRVDVAAGTLEWRGYVHVQSHHQHPHLQSTAAGTTWLGLSPHDRLAALLDPMRASKARNPRGAYETSDTSEFFPYTMPYYREPKGLNLRDALTTAFAELTSGFYPVASFLEHAARHANPFFALSRAETTELHRYIHLGGMDPRERFDALWRSALMGFLVSRMLIFGGARLGRLADGTLCFAVTEIGQYLLGATARFEYGDTGAADLVVQPNFDLVLLGTSPSLEAKLARIAERVGVAPGLAFRITRASIVRAAESGLTADSVLATLRDASSKALPPNVQREVAGWMWSVRRAQLRTIEVVDCGNDETADRVVLVLGAKCTRLTASLVELPTTTPSARAALIKKLRAGGVLLNDQTGGAKAAPKKRRRAESEWEE